MAGAYKKLTFVQTAELADYNDKLDDDGRNELALAGYNSLAEALERGGLPAVWAGTAAAGLGLIGEAKLADILQVLEKGTLLNTIEN